ncbi:MAG TPA: RnfH family protein [Steroidobacteraceae bacterium]|nr:RnfH family protein [Steroidobacteraceae bacterium]
MTEAPSRKRCQVAYATPTQQFLWSVELAPAASVADALQAARQQAPPDVAIAWDSAEVGIYGEICERSAIPAAGDRIEIYRPLTQDPRQRRRESVRGQRRKRPR